MCSGRIDNAQGGIERAGSLQMVSPTSVSMGTGTSSGQRAWTFDHIAGPETSQDAFFTGAATTFSQVWQPGLSCACTLLLRMAHAVHIQCPPPAWHCLCNLSAKLALGE